MVMISADGGMLILRIILSFVFLVHGFPKLFKDLQGTSGFLSSLGFKPGIFWALILGVTEFFGGLALLVGFVSRVAAGALIISMTVATLLKIFKWKTPFTQQQAPGWEFDFVLLGGLIALFLLGSGSISVDQYFGWILG
ncbi:DoxX family protein [Candidatus Woesearchaeota archaeon]|nr:DoxX family protein [Candidatus Woesearchaeota archaeon]